MPPTVPMPDNAGNENQPESAVDEASTEAGKVSTVDEKGPKTCAADVAGTPSAADEDGV